MRGKISPAVKQKAEMENHLLKKLKEIERRETLGK